MPDAFALANAFVRIRPTSDGFKASADAQIHKALAGLDPTVNIGAQTKGAKAAALDLKAYLDALTKQAYDFRLVADDKDLQARLAKIFVQLIGIQGMMVAPKITLAGYARMQAELLSIGAELDKVAGRVVTAHVDVTGDAEKGLALLNAQITALTSRAKNIKLGISDAGDLAAITQIQRALAGVASHASTLSVTTDVTQIANARQQVATLASLLVSLTAKEDTAAAATRTFAGGWGAFNTHLSATVPILGTAIHSVALWHIALDLLVETFIAVTLALASLALGIGVMAESIRNIGQHLNAVSVVAGSLGQVVTPLTGKFDKLGLSLAPRAIEAYGGALALVGRNADALLQAAGPVVNMFDTWIAKIDIWANSQTGLQKILKSGMGFLSQFGQIFGNVGQAIGNLVRADPGTAHFLGDIFVGASKLLSVFTSLPAPIVFTVLAIHSLYVWLGLASVVLVKLGAYAVNVGRMLMGLSTNPLFWVAAAAAAVAYLGVSFGKADSSARGFIAGLNSTLGSDNAQQAILQIGVDIGELNKKIATAGSAQAMAGIKANWANLGNTAQSFDADLQGVGHNLAAFFDEFNKTGPSNAALSKLGDAIKGIFVPGGGANEVVLNNIRAYQQEINKLLGQQDNLFKETGLLTSQGFTWAQALALENLAGIKANDTFQIMRVKVENLITGYEKMSVQGGILANSVNAVTLVSLIQHSQIGQLTAGWDAFFKLVTSSDTGFVTFQQDMLSVNQALAQAGGSARTVTNTFGTTQAAIAKAAKVTGASMTGLNAASLQLQSTYNAAAAGAQQEADALLSQASASGLGAKGTDMVTAAVKDMVIQLLPGAKNSKVFTTALYALAQQGGFQGANSFKALSGWVNTASGSIGKAKDPARQLQRIMGDLTAAVGNLKDDVQHLSAALGTTLSDAMAKAIVTAAGGQTPFNNFAKAVLNVHQNSTTTQKAADALGKELITVYGNARDAKAQFETLAIAGLHLTKVKADELWASFIRQQLTMAASKAGETKGAFDKLATSLGVSKTKADNLWTSLHKVAAGSPYNSKVNVSTPHAFIFAEKSGGVNNPVGELHVSQSAKGSKVPGYGGGDRHLYLLEGGEAVVSKEATAKHAGTLRAMGVPGMQSGGVISPLPGMVATALGQDEGAALLANVNAALAADIAAGKSANKAAAAMSFAGGPGGGAPGANAALARRLMPSWGSGSEWAAWNSVAMAESGWNQFARNPGSGAYGIPQALPPGKMGAAANPPQSNPTAQIRWMISYIRSVYGDPLGAWAHEQAFHWYAGGTKGAQPGWAMVGERGPEMVHMEGGETVLSNPQSKAVIRGMNGYAKGTKTPLNEKLDHVLTFIRKNANNPVRYTNLALRLQPLAGQISSDKLLVKSGQVHGRALASLRTEIRHDEAESKRLTKQIQPYEQTRQWVKGVESGLASRDKKFSAEAGAALAKHMPNVAARLQRHVARDTADTAKMNQWLNRVEPAADTYLNPNDRSGIHDMIVDDLKMLGLPVIPFDQGGWLRPGRTLAVNNTGRSERILGPGEGTAHTVELAFTGSPSGQVERALWLWLQKSVASKGGGNVQAALGRKD